MSQINDITKHFTVEFWENIESAIDNANERGAENAEIWDLLFIIINNSRIRSLLGEEKIIEIRGKILPGIKKISSIPPKTTKVSTELYKFILYTYLVSKKYDRLTVHIEDSLLAFFSFPQSMEVFSKLKLNLSQLSLKIIETLGGKDETSQNTKSFINKFSENLNNTIIEKRIEIIGREDEISQLIRTFTKQSGKYPILVGEEGIGKESIILGFVLELQKSNCPDNLKNTEVLKINLNAFSNNNGAERINNIINNIIEEAKISNKILYIENIHILSNSYDKSDYTYFQSQIRSVILNNEIKIIGTTSTSNYRKYLEEDSLLLPKLDILKISEPNDIEVTKICRLKSKDFENFHNVRISESAIESAVDLSKKYLTEKFLPTKALDLLDEAAALNSGQEVIDEDIKKILSVKTGIPLEKLSQDEKEKLLGLEDILNSQVKGQEKSIYKVAEVIRRARAGLKDSKKPIGSFLFLGPSGVGKTELAKTIAQAVYDTPKAMIRLDMSEFSESHTVQRLVGAPPGYVGYEEGGQLTNPIWERPYSLILLDEIEKAHPKVFDIFLQVLDDGRLTDGQGRTVDFRNTIIIATSNIGSEKILGTDQKYYNLEGNGSLSKETSNTLNDQRNTGLAKAFGMKLISQNQQVNSNDEIVNSISMDQMLPILKQYFRPEFINRFDEIIIFNPLSKAVLSDILNLQIRNIELKLKDREIKIVLTENTRKKILEESYNPQFGARPLLRNIQEKVENYIANKIIKGEISANSTIEI